MKVTATTARRVQGDILLGFLPLIDAAPIIIAKEFGIFKQYGLSVSLSREPGWATVRDKLSLARELDASHALAGLAFAVAYGIGCAASPCITGYVINERGNAITISSDLKGGGLIEIADLSPSFVPQDRPLRFASVHPSSSHHALLHQVFSNAGFRIGEDVELLILPPELMPSCLDDGHIDGFCVGEPWNSVARDEFGAHCLSSSAELSLSHPEKILLATGTFLEHRPEEHLGLIAALAEAGRVCDDPENRPEIARILASERYLDTSPELVANSLCSPFGHGAAGKTPASEMHHFSGADLNCPSAEKANLVLGQLRTTGFIKGSLPKTPKPEEVFRSDLYDAALLTHVSTASAETKPIPQTI